MTEAIQRRAGGSGEGYDSPKNLRIRGIQCLPSDGSGPVKVIRESGAARKPSPKEGLLHGFRKRFQEGNRHPARWRRQAGAVSDRPVRLPHRGQVPGKLFQSCQVPEGEAAQAHALRESGERDAGKLQDSGLQGGEGVQARTRGDAEVIQVQVGGKRPQVPAVEDLENLQSQDGGKFLQPMALLHVQPGCREAPWEAGEPTQASQLQRWHGKAFRQFLDPGIPKAEPVAPDDREPPLIDAEAFCQGPVLALQVGLPGAEFPLSDSGIQGSCHGDGEGVKANLSGSLEDLPGGCAGE